MMNQCNFLGRLTRKPEFHVTKTGKSVVSFTLAVDRDVPDREGQWIADFIDFVAWNKMAEKIFNRNYDKGDLLAVTSKFQNRTRTDSEGNTIVVAEFLVQTCRRIPINKHSSDSNPASPSENFSPLDDDKSPLPFY